MNATETFQQVSRLYAAGARALLAPTGAVAMDRGRPGPESYTDLGTQANVLLPVSERFTAAASAELETASPDVRSGTETALLAKVLSDLEISDYLLQAARDEEAEAAWTAPRALDRGFATVPRLEPTLELLLGEEEEPPVYRGVPAVATIEHARHQLKEDVGDTLLLISGRASGSGQVALEGLLGIGLGQVAKAAGFVGMDIAEALGQAEKVSRLYDAFRGFLRNAYNSIMALLGPDTARKAAEEVPKWLEKLNLGEQLDSLLGRLFHIEDTRVVLTPLIDASDAAVERYVNVSRMILALNNAFQRKTGLIDKILPKIRYVGMIPGAALPAGQLLMAAAYIALGGYVLFLGGDYLDSTHIRFLDRVPGVRRVVEKNLAAQEE
jgi:hypothetical protein